MSSKTDVVELDEIKVVEPKRYKAIIHNDDTTPVDFVAMVLTEIYRKSVDEAWDLTMQTHNDGSAVIKYGLKGYLESLSDDALAAARKYGFKDFTITNEEE